MSGKMTKVPLPNGVTLEAMEVSVTESTERWSDITLEDGTVLRVKPNVLSVHRAIDKYDDDGNPLYVLKSAQVMMVSSTPPNLRKGGAGSKVQ